MALSFKNRKNPTDKTDQSVAAHQALKRHIPRWRWFIIVLLVSMPFIYFFFHLLDTKVWANAQGFMIFDLTEIRAPSNGYIKNVKVKIGQPIEKGHVLLKFVSYKEQITLKYLKKEIRILTEIKKNLMKKEREINIIQRKILGNDLLESIRYYDIFKKELRNTGNINIIQKNDARKKIVDIKEKLQVLRENRLQKFSNIEIYYSREIRKAQQEVDKLEDIKKYYTILAPENGVLTDILVHNGEFTMEGKTMMKLALGRNIHIRAFLPARFLSYAKIGKKVTIIFSDGKRVKGEVAYRPHSADQVPENNEIAIKKRNKIVVVIKLLETISVRYYINALPVKVNFNF